MDVARTFYLLLALAGLIFPVRRFVEWFNANGLDFGLLAQSLGASEPSRGLTSAIVIASLATVVFIVGEATTRRDWLSMICVPVTLLLGAAVGLPLYLFMRLRRLH